MKVHIDESLLDRVKIWYIDPETRDGYMVSIFESSSCDDTTLRFLINRIHDEPKIEFKSYMGLPNPFYIIDEDPKTFERNNNFVVYSLKTKTIRTKAVEYLLLRHEMPAIYDMINGNEDVYNTLKQLRDKYQL